MDGREPVVVEARRTSLVDVQATYVRVESLRTAGAPPRIGRTLTRQRMVVQSAAAASPSPPAPGSNATSPRCVCAG